MNGGNPAVPDNDEIGPGVNWRLTRRARYPLDPPAIPQFLRLGNWLISKVRVSSLDRARAPTRGVVFTEDVVKIAGEQGRYAVGHNGSVLTIVNFFGLFHLTRIRRMFVL